MKMDTFPFSMQDTKKAAGNNPDTICKVITDRLQEHAPEPQVKISRSAGDGSKVSIIGVV